MVGKKVLLLGGTSDAFDLAQYFFQLPTVNVITSFSGATKNPRVPAGKFRTGGFGGVEGLCRYLKEENINLIIDATHPFAVQITRNAIAAARVSEVPIVHLVRDAWHLTKQDAWCLVPNLQAAVDKLYELCDFKTQTVFLSIGRKDIEKFAKIKRAHFVVRSIEKPTMVDNFPNSVWIRGRGPFSYEEEYWLLKKRCISVLVAKNSGGISGKMKLKAARALKLPVIMIERPTPPNGEIATSSKDLIQLVMEKGGLL